MSSPTGNRKIRSRILASTLWALLAAFATVPTAFAGSSALAAPPVPGSLYQLQVVNSGLKLEVAFAATGPAPIIQAGASATYRPSQWHFVEIHVDGDGVPDFHQIVNRNSGLCVNSGPASVRLVIYQNSCAVGPTTHWKLEENPATGDFEILSRTTTFKLCIIGDLTFPAVPLVSDTQSSSCDKRFHRIPVS